MEIFDDWLVEIDWGPEHGGDLELGFRDVTVEGGPVPLETCERTKVSNSFCRNSRPY